MAAAETGANHFFLPPGDTFAALAGVALKLKIAGAAYGSSATPAFNKVRRVGFPISAVTVSLAIRLALLSDNRTSLLTKRVSH
jgi:hypothetical protein